MFEWAALAVFAVSGLWLSIIDQREHRLPNVGTASSLAFYVVIALLAKDDEALRSAAVGSVLGALFFAVWAVVPPRSLGMGDVKLQVGLGFLLGWLDLSLVAAQVAGSVILGGLAAVWLMAVRKAPATTQLPFGPFMIAAGALSVFIGKSAEII